jgi:hypothetical protein
MSERNAEPELAKLLCHEVNFQRRRADRLASELAECARQLALMAAAHAAVVAEAETWRRRFGEAEAEIERLRNG